MEKAVVLSDSDRGQNSVDRWLLTNTSETARLVCCLCHIFVSTYTKWINDGAIISICYSFGKRRVIQKKDIGDSPH